MNWKWRRQRWTDWAVRTQLTVPGPTIEKSMWQRGNGWWCSKRWWGIKKRGEKREKRHLMRWFIGDVTAKRLTALTLRTGRLCNVWPNTTRFYSSLPVELMVAVNLTEISREWCVTQTATNCQPQNEENQSRNEWNQTRYWRREIVWRHLWWNLFKPTISLG